MNMQDYANEPTQKQSILLRYWKDYQEKNGCPPSINRAAKDLQLKSPTAVQNMMKILVRKGLMVKKPVMGIGLRHNYVVADDRTV